MGTGVVATLLNRLPYNGSWLYYLSIVVFVLNAVLFCVALILSVIRYWMWPRIWTIMSRDRHHSLFLGALPIGFTTLINMLLYVCVPAWGTWVATLAWVLWIIDSIVALFVTFLVPYITMTHGERSALHTVNAVQLLPLSSTLSSASTGSLVAGALPNPEHALWTMIASYALLGVGLPLVMTVLAIYYQRLTLHHLPPREVIVSVFLPVSPLCLASFSLLRLGSVAAQTIPRNPTTLKYASAGETLHTFGCITAVILWAHSLVWLAYAVASIAHQRHFPFNMGWWSFTFPLGMLALDTIAIGTELGSAFFRVLGTVCFVPFFVAFL
ncbi:C4-dicarboxylate transporter/malic acid transport protein [Aaosphaeria arxii CBS 175.79]|uniref:C4-dicarboxylate transporter/malic acid transport protein n=1 Tax=Aaosphaeria arxii CBS 175.79 TaxID=1450172 RepID=A0A6A5XXF2_9PLEO|nr:C4-dicarboxylate transporter/malic acid transport protein [Aaosphaeria arxii CBS 175.79]KAF2017573.1 C4-dicarboxylate transporter/malic acid transport protein [Aaosphaeria arxii CBS 175.79]